MPISKKKPKGKLPLELVDDTPKIDWEKIEISNVSEATKELWYNSAIETVRNENVDSFKKVLKSILPVSEIVYVFQKNWNDDIADIDIVKIAVVRGNKPIIDCIIVVLGESKFYEFAKWGPYWGIYIAAIWGHVELVELFHDYHIKHGGDPIGVEGETVKNMAARYRHSIVIEYYDWCDLRAKYVRVLESLLRNLKKAFPQQEPVAFTAEDLNLYQADCEEKMKAMTNIKFNAFQTKILWQGIDEASELRLKVKIFLPKSEDLSKGKGRNGTKKSRKKNF